jgi:hypothetical protein
MIEFTKAKDKFTDKCFSFEIDHKLEELEMGSQESSLNGFSKNIFRISKDEAKKLFEYLSEWIKEEQK